MDVSVQLDLDDGQQCPRSGAWAIEMGESCRFGVAGQGCQTFTPGMKIKTVIHPLRDGNNGGQFMAITLPDGTLMGNPNAAPSANAGAGPTNQ